MIAVERPRYASVFFFLLGYVITMVAIFYGLISAREDQRGRSAGEAEAAWTIWREAAAEQASPNGPVQRKIPKSPLPPIRVLLLHHFGTMATGALVFGSILYGMFCFLVRGMLIRSHVPSESQHDEVVAPRPEDGPD